MSLKVAATEINRFLASAEPEVLCITGPWGAGKTYAWNLYLRAAKTVALDDYAYVSLFGQNSLQDVRNSIFENTECLKAPQAGSGLSSWKEKSERIGRQIAKYRQLVSSFTSEAAISIGERWMFASLKPTIVCIDDLERAGDGLSKKDVLGLVTQLKEQKKSKVVLLLNAAALGNDQADFDQQIEKVADTIIAFAPTPKEAAVIGISSNAPECEILREHATKLRIQNIRVIKRIERTGRRLADLLKGHDPRVLRQALHTAAVYVFARYQPDSAPSADFIHRYNTIVIDEEDRTDHPEWREILSDYGFGYADEFDHVVANGIIAGHFDEEQLLASADQKHSALLLQDKDASFQAAWDRYHNSFDNDQEEVLDQMFDAFKQNIAAISPLNAAGAAKFFKDLGRPDQARELIEFYVANREGSQEFWDLDNSMFSSEITDPDVRGLFREKLESLSPPPVDPAEILLRISKTKSWSRRDIERLAQLSADDFYALFKAPHGTELQRITGQALRFRSSAAEGSAEYQISQNADAALDRIAGESPINARRVRQHRSR